ncbi:MAG: flagellar biosynthesis regulator FlaF [Rhizobiaceae bacterium]|jgi:flagellar protein FlaF|nr:flagellar biosynthesis regulator FlaF [Rhizobiaceae bacterium]
MFMQAYEDVMEDEQDALRSSEAQVIDRTIRLMQESDQKPSDRMLRTRAIHLTSQVWSYFLNDLASSENATPKELKASLISIGIYIMKHLNAMRSEESLGFGAVTEVSINIREGLK